jgi:hypothetical protein
VLTIRKEIPIYLHKNYLERKALALDPGSPDDLGFLPPLVGEELA